MTPLYSLRTDGDQYRITKFVDGDVESTYLCTESECECPAGHRHTCRHRQMLPTMLAHKLDNTHWFFAFDTGGQIVDFNGTPKRLFDELAALGPELAVDQHCLQDTSPAPTRQTFTIPEGHKVIRDAEGRATGETRAVPEGQHCELTIAHSITLPDDATSEDVANAFAGIQQQAKPWRRL